METCFIHIDDNGELKNPAALQKAMRLKPGRYKVEIKRAGKRSLQQNRYYWGVVVDLVKQGLFDLGHEVSAEETHDWLKAKFNYLEVVNEETGECEHIPRSTTEMTKEQFGEFIERIAQFAAEFLGVVIPAPNSQMAIDYTT